MLLLLSVIILGVADGCLIGMGRDRGGEVRGE